jgi:hypothetical protein
VGIEKRKREIATVRKTEEDREESLMLLLLLPYVSSRLMLIGRLLPST